jgi:hypothetical protein
MPRNESRQQRPLLGRLFLGGHCRERAVKSQSEATCYKTAISLSVEV